MVVEMKAIRGAITVDADRRDLIIEAGQILTETILKENNIEIEQIVSAIYTSTADLVSEFPAVGARKAGLVDTALICAQEIPVPGGLPRCVRVLMHVYVKANQQVRPVYLKDAVKLRPDLINQAGGREES